jgi:amino acid adenylation domain-containing protein/non-ribosomal peptide synthase protein (TIGR01720 family)
VTWRRGSTGPAPPPIVRSPAGGGVHPLSYSQQRLWFFDRLEPGRAVYNVSLRLGMQGRLDVRALAATLSEVVRRHEVLRSRLASANGSVLQVVEASAAHLPLPLPVVDLSRLPAARQQEAGEGVARVETGRPFDLERSPLLRLLLVRRGEEDHEAVLTMHHIASDAWSLGILVHEVGVLYPRLAADEGSPLAELPIQYGDFARWQREWLQGEVLESQLAYWRGRLAGTPGVLNLPLDRPRPAVQSFSGARRRFDLPVALSTGLLQLGRRCGATLFMTLLAGFKALLWHYTGQEDLVVGTPVAGRTRLETEGLIGFFVNTLILRTELQQDASFADLLGQVREASLAAHAHQDVPFERLVEELRPERDLSRTPLFQVMFTLQNAPLRALSLPGLALAPVEVAVSTAKFDLELMLVESAGGLRGGWTWSTDLFDGSTIARLEAHLERLLESFVAAPESSLASLLLLSAAERHQLDREWNDSALPGEGESVVDLWERQAALRRAEPALFWGEVVLSFGEIDGRANGLARRLRSLGVGRESRVGLCVERSPDLVVGLLGIWKAGGAYVPLEPSYPESRLRFLLEDSGATVVVVGAEPPAALQGLGIEPVHVDGERSEGRGEGPWAGDLAYLIYTSGTTGTPKGVMVEHGSLANLLRAGAARFEWTAGDRMPCMAPLSFDIFLFELFSPLLAGGRSELLSLRPVLDLGQVMSALARSTRMHAVPTLLRQVVERARLAPARYTALQTVFVGGDAVPADLLRDAAEAFPGAQLQVLYGPTEGTVLGASHTVPAGSCRPLLGRPLPNAVLSVRDRRGERVAVGVAGELYLGGPGVSRGYLHRPELTAERFVPIAGERQYRTGDLARVLADGRLEFVGRVDGQVKVRGFRIEPGEVETALLRQDGVAEAVVVARQEGVEKRLVAYLVAASGRSPLDFGPLRQALRAALPDYLVPSAFIELGTLPLTAHGKVDRAALPAPERSGEIGRTGRKAPRIAAERTLARIWSEVLGVVEVGIEDNFFDLGGDSILTLQILARAHRAGLRLTPRQMFEHQTIETLAAAGAAPESTAEQGLVTGSALLTPVQHLFFSQDREPRSRFVQMLLFAVSERLSTPALAASMDVLVRHHDALRLRFFRQGAEWTARHAAPAAAVARVARIDLAALPAERRPAELAVAAERVSEGFDLGAGPLVAAVAIDLGGAGGAGGDDAAGERLLLSIHHLLVDGVSWRLLLEDLAGAKTTSFAAWTERLAEHAAGAAREELAFWRDAELPAALPLDRIRGENDGPSARQVRVSLSAAETESLLRRVPAVYRTRINDVLLTALTRALWLWSGSRRVLVALEGHGRAETFVEVDLSRTVGWLTAVYPVVLEVPDVEAAEAESLQAIKEQLRRVPRGGVGYGALRYLTVGGEGGLLPFRDEPEVSFNYLGQLDPVLEPGSLLRPASESVRGPALSGPRPYLFEVSGAVAGGRFEISLTYSRNRHRRATAEALARSFATELRRLVEHCLSPGVGAYTPSDFPLAGLDPATLGRLVADYPDLEDIYPLSPMQEGMLFETLSAPGTGLYVTQMSCELSGDLDETAFERAWQMVVDRHAILRTAFTGTDLNRPLQVVQREVRLAIERQDWRESGHQESGKEERERRLESLLAEDRGRCFALDRPPLLRLFLLRTGEHSWRLIWSHHHILLDGWSLSTFATEAFAAYGSLTRGEKPRLNPPSRFRDYIAWLERQDLGQAETYWRDRLAGFGAAPSLWPERRSGDFDGAREERRRLPAALTGILEGLARRSRLTLNTLLQGAWALLLAHYGGGSDVVFGVTVAGRPEQLDGIESMVGLFINTLPVRVEVRPQDRLGAWLSELQGEQVRMREFEHAPLSRILEWSGGRRRAGLFQTLFVFENYPAAAAFEAQAGRGDLGLADVRAAERTGFPLTFGARKRNDSLELRFLYEVSSLDRVAVLRIADHVTTLLQSFAEGFAGPLSSLRLLTAGERHQTLVEWNDTAVRLAEETLGEAFLRQARARSAAVAVSSGAAQLSFGELARRSGGLADWLAERGVGPEVPVGLSMERSIELIVGILAVVRAGGVYMPLDPQYPAERLELLIRDSGAQVILTAADTGVLHVASGGSASPPRLALGPDQLVYLMYTSGSTGTPKGVAVTHRGVQRLIAGANYVRLTPEDRIAQVCTPAFDVATFEIWGALLSGARLVVPPSRVLSLDELGRELRQSGVTVLWLTAGLFHQMIESQTENLAGVEQLLAGGDVLSPAHVGMAHRLLSGCRLINGYGPTEGTTFTCCHRIEEVDPDASVPIGRPISNTTVAILDLELRRVPIGVMGELCAGGMGVARGYWGDPARTAERFIPDPEGKAPGARLYRTGDRARFLSDGKVEFLGRLDRQVKLRGFRVEPGEVETVLATHTEVREVAVDVRPEPGGGRRLVAWVVGEVSTSELRRYLLGKLPEHAVPSAFVSLPALPLTAQGKVDRRALPDAEVGTGTGEWIAPRTPFEEMLAAIWSEVLGHERLGVTEDFFALGGHSLLATRVASRVRSVFGVEISPALLFEAPTVARAAAAIAELISSGRRPAPAPIVRSGSGAGYPLSYAQQRLWFFEQLEPGRAVYNVPLHLRITGRLQVWALGATLSEVVRRHEVLRSRFASEEGKAVQWVEPPAIVTLPVVDLSRLPADRQREVSAGVARVETGRPFDLGHSPLVRLLLVRLGEKEHEVVLTMHHIASDGWSLGVLVREVAALYPRWVEGEGSPLPELPIQYGDFARWQRQWLAGEVLEAQLAYWRDRLAGSPGGLGLPLDRPRPAVQSFRGARRRFALSAELSLDLLRLSRRRGATLFMTLLSGFQALLWRYTGQEDLSVGTPVAGRTRLETEELIGFFVNTLVLRTELESEASFATLLAGVRETSLGAHAHQDVPFERLVEELRPERDLSRTPLFQVMFTLQNAPLGGLALPGLVLVPVETVVETAKFDLELTLLASERGLEGGWTWSSDLFDGSTLARLESHLERLLAGIVAAPESRLASLPLLGEAEQHQLGWEWSDSRLSGEAMSVVDLWERQAASRGDEPALLWGEETLSFGEIEGRANALAGRLRALGVGRESRVGLSVERSPALVVGLLGIWKAGGAYVPLDPSYPEARLRFLVEDSGARVVVTGAEPLSVLQDLGVERVPVGTLRAARLEERPRAEDLAYLIYTSGTTGTPKGVMVEHGSLANLLRGGAARFGWTAEDRMPCMAPFTFDIFLFELLSPLLAGGRSELLSLRPVLDLDQVMSALARSTRVHAVPTLLRQVVERARQEPSRYAGVRTVFVGGDTVPADLLRDAAEVLPWARFHVLYGPTEGTVLGSSHAVPAGSCRPLLGRPLANVVLTVRDRRGERVPVGVAGEIYLGGPGVSRGYLNRPQLTAEKYVAVEGERQYRTGDLARVLADGNLEFLGRVDGQVKIRGFRVEPGEVEAVLLAQAGVGEAVVVARQDGAEKSLVAYLVPAGGGSLDSGSLGSLRQALRAELPDYLVPSAFVVLGALPLTAHGKVDRAALPAPERSAEIGPGGRRAPRTAEERILAQVWSEVLGVAEVGIEDNFFDLGGDSILTLQILARAHRAGLRLTPRQMFEHQTIAALAAAAATTPEAIAPQGLITGSALLTPVQHSFFTLDLAPRSGFVQALLFAVSERLSTPALAAAMDLLARHHDALRLRFFKEAGSWTARHADPTEVVTRVARIDLSALPEERRRPELTITAARVPESFDLAAGPLVAAMAFDLGGDGAHGERLLLSIHHLLVDGVSLRVLLEDFATAYRAAATGRPATLPGKTTSFAAWAERLAESATGSLREELGFWRDAERLASLPRDTVRGENDGASARQVRVSLSAAETEALLRRVPAAYRTRINDVLLTALARSFTRWTGDRRVLVALEGHGREEFFPDVDLSRTVGWFTAVYPVILELPEAGEESGALAASLKAIKERLRRLPHGGLGYGVLRYLGPDGEALASLGEPEVSFNYLGQLDRVLEPASLLRPAGESVRSPALAVRRHYLLEVVGSVAGDRLAVSFTYSKNRHRRVTVEALARSFATELRRLVEHCLSPGAGGYTPSDFPLARLDSATLDRLVAAYPDVEDIYPLSPMQEGMLFETLSAPGTGLYVTQMSCELSGDLDEAAFERAWQTVVDHYAVLRSLFTGTDLARPLQVVQRQVRLTLLREDWRRCDEAERERRLESLLAADRERGFELDRPPLQRLSLLRSGERTWLLVWSHHHLLLDGWSLSTVTAAVFAAYEALVRGEEPDLGRARPYRDYIAWLESQDLGPAEVYWRELLAGFRVATPLRLEPRPGAAPGAQEESRRLPVALTGALEGLARRHRLTLNTLLQGVWAILLSRYSGESDVVFGVTVSGRPESLPGVESILGLFVNTLPVRVEILPQSALGPWLGRLQQQQVRMRELEHTPLARIQGWSDVPRGTGLFHTLFSFENFPVGAAFQSQAGHASTLSLGRVRTSERAGLPISFGVFPGEGLSLYAGFDPRFLDVASVHRMLGHFGVLLAAFPGGFERPLGALPMLTEPEVAQLLVEWNDTALRGPGERCLHTLFEIQTQWTPQAPAVISGWTAHSYAELNGRANQLAHALRALGIGPEVAVGIFLERSLELLVAVLGVLKSGGAYVPIDPDYPADRVSFMLQDIRVAAVVTERRLADRLDAASAPLLLLDEDGPALAEHSRKNPAPLATPASLAYAIYTSGSTGLPKAALIEHRSLSLYAADFAERLGLTPRDRFLQFASPGFDVLGEELFPIWWSGGAVVLPEAGRGGRKGQVPAPQELSRLLEERGVTVFELPTGYWQEWIYDLALRGQPLPRTLRLAIVGGQRVSPDRLRDWRRTGLPLVNVYGLTEVTITSTLFRLAPDGPTPGESFELPIGRPTGGTRLYVLDAGYQPVPVGSPGELFIGGPGCARGYFGRPELTAERFVPDPFAGGRGARLYRTGDLVRYRAEGDLYFLGRLDNQVKVRGYRIEPGEIEALLCRCPGVQEAVVLAHPDASGETALTAYLLVGGEDRAPEVAEIRSFLLDRLPAYMVPATLLPLRELPRTPHGKIDRSALPRPGEIRAARAVAGTAGAPRDLLELELARIWEEVLAVPAVGVADNFFELGGQSLSALRLMAQIETRFGRGLPILTLFQAPTVEGLAALLRQAIGELPYSPLVEIQRGGVQPGFYCVHPAGGGVLAYRDLARHLGPDRPFYAFQAPGLTAGQEPLDRIERLAASYLAALRGRQPQGPYLLGGWSFGTYVALEMAQQLQAAGEEVSLLVVLDTAAQPDGQGRDPLKVGDARLLYETLGLDIQDEDLATFDEDGKFSYVIELARQRKILPPGFEADHARRHIRLFKAHAAAERAYRPQSYPGRVVLLRAAEQPEASRSSRDLGWGTIALGGLEVLDVPGNHTNMLQLPQIEELARLLRRSLPTVGSEGT